MHAGNGACGRRQCFSQRLWKLVPLDTLAPRIHSESLGEGHANCRPAPHGLGTARYCASSAAEDKTPLIPNNAINSTTSTQQGLERMQAHRTTMAKILATEGRYVVIGEGACATEEDDGDDGEQLARAPVHEHARWCCMLKTSA
jgi:hypothetical protein